jgi:hypothetical protein
MIVYTDTKQQFVEDVIDNLIHDKILEMIKSKGVGGGMTEERSANTTVSVSLVSPSINRLIRRPRKQTGAAFSIV